MSLDEFYEAICDWIWFCIDNNVESDGIIDQIYANYFGYVEDLK